MAEADAKNLSDAHTEQPSLEGRKAVITGGTTGIGRAIAVLLASEGVEVFTCGRHEQHLADALDRIGEVGKGGGIALDLAEADGVDRFFAAAEKALGSYDIAVVNAGIPADGVSAMSAEEVRCAIATDFTAYVLSAQRPVAHMKSASELRGDIVMTGSYSVHKLGPESTVYAGIKAGVHGFAEALRREVSQDGIKVGLVVPALTGADFQYPDIPAEKQREKIKAEEMLRAEDIAVAVQFMLTQPSRAVVQELVMVQRNTDA